jgi:hypothetical protein
VNRVRSRFLGCALAIAALGIVCSSALAAATPNKPSTVPLPSVISGFNGGFEPSSLPKTKLTPVALLLEGNIRSLDGSHPPALRELAIELDRNISVDLGGYPACHVGGIQIDPTMTLEERCPSAFLGNGSVHFEIQLDEQEPIQLQSELQIYNAGRKSGIPTIYFSAYLDRPVPGLWLATAKIKKTDNGIYRTKVTVAFPKVAGGGGSITSFNMRIKKRLSLNGKPFSPVTARCPNGKLQAHFSGEFFDYATSEATNTSTEILRTCTGR